MVFKVSLSALRVFRAGLFAGLFVSAAFAANYNATVYHEGDLYFKVVNGRETVQDCKSAESGVKFKLDSKKLATSEIQFFSDASCKTPITSVTGNKIFVSSQTATVTLNADGTISQGAPSVPKSSSSVTANSSSSVKSSSSKTPDPVNPTSSSSSATPSKNGKKTIAFFAPWTNTNAILFMNGDSVGIMKAMDKYCGWYGMSITPSESGLKTYFKQTVGLNYVSSEGLVQEEPMNSTNIVLDTFPEYKTADTIWIQGYKADVPAVFFKYPGVLGDCPLKKFPVTLFDWLHGSKGDGVSGNGSPEYGISADFGSGGCGGGNATRNDGKNSYRYMAGMVEKELGPNGVPVRANPFPTDCKITEHLDYWFLPESLAVDAQGNTLTNMTCRDLYISMDDEGFWLAEVSKDNISKGNEFNKGGMFLLDDFQYLDEKNTIKNPYYEQLTGTDKRQHNFGFTMKIQATFEYVPGQYFDFLGDDDVWVFINNKLVVDIGGQHAQVPGAVDLDTIGQNNPADKLVPGEIYNFHIFYVERHTGSSNFKMRTSIDLKVDAAIFVTNTQKGDNSNYEVWQINKKNKLSCGYDPNNTEVDTTAGPSTFRLTGGNLDEPQILEIGKTYYEGLTISSDHEFTINVEAIKAAGSLAPGHYFLEIALKSDPSQTMKVEITIPTYAVPTVAYVKSDGTILGPHVSGDSVQIGDFAYATYPVTITFLEDWAKVNTFNKKINLTFSDSTIDILDTIGGSKINYVYLDSATRQATFYVHANSPVEGATLSAKGTAAEQATWINLNFVAPPTPQVSKAIIHDVNGDGRADSLYVRFDRDLSNSTFDNIQFTFGETHSTKKVKKLSDTEIAILARDVYPAKCTDEKICGFSSRQFTGNASSEYTGSFSYWITLNQNGKTSQFYKEGDAITDGVGPIILSAVKSVSSDGNRHIALKFSEAITSESRNKHLSMFEFICMRSGQKETPENPIQQSGSDNSMTLIYSAPSQDEVLPTNGDLIRFTPKETDDGTAEDLAGNAPHMDNPWVTITGDQDIESESPGVIGINDDNPIISSVTKETATIPTVIADPYQSAQQIGDSLGVQGHLIDFDISKIMIEETQRAVNALDAYIESKLGTTITETRRDTCDIDSAAALDSVFQLIISDNGGVALSDSTIEAIIAKKIDASNFKDVLSSEESKYIMEELLSAVIEEHTKTIIERDTVTVDPETLFAIIATGELDEELKKAGVSNALIKAIKDGDVTPTNIDEYRNGSRSIIAEDAVEFFFRTRYYGQLGDYVGGSSKTIRCSDESIYGEGGCLNNKGRLFLAWNMRSDSGRLVGTGVYIARLQVKVTVNGETTVDQTRDKMWGVRRTPNSRKDKSSNLNAEDFGL